MDPTVLWVDAEVFERDIAKIRIGQEVQVTVLAYPGEVFRGKISYINETMNAETRTLNVRTEVQNRDFKLKHGMFADVSIILNGGLRVLTVPTEAVLENNNQDIVFVKTDGGYAARIVTVSAEQNGYSAIAEGLREGEEVVVKNAYLLKSKLYDELLKKAGVH
jgi:cobalt-zinc-cadmium efflux system membrane fusion protein